MLSLQAHHPPSTLLHSLTWPWFIISKETLVEKRVQKYIVLLGEARLTLSILSCPQVICQLYRGGSGLHPISQTPKMVVSE